MLVVVALVAVVAVVCAIIVFGGAWVVDRLRGDGGGGRPDRRTRPPRPERGTGSRRLGTRSGAGGAPSPAPERGRATPPAAPPSSAPGAPSTPPTPSAPGAPGAAGPGAADAPGAAGSGASGAGGSGSDETAGAGVPGSAGPADASTPATPSAAGPRGPAEPQPSGETPGPTAAPMPVTLQSLDPEMRSVYASSWQRTQERFRQEPESALSDADKLVTLLLDERGYPTRSGGLTEVSSDPVGVVPDYQAAHRITSGKRPLTAQEMRKAMDAYRRLVSALLEDRPARGRR